MSIFLKIYGNFFMTLQDYGIKVVVTRGRIKKSQRGKCWFTGLTNAVIREYNCIRISPHLGVNKEAKWHHSHCKHCGASCHADAAKKLVRVTVNFVLAYNLSYFLLMT